MKKPFLIIGLLLAIGLVKAQNISMDFIPFHDTGYDVFSLKTKSYSNETATLSPMCCWAFPVATTTFYIAGYSIRNMDYKGGIFFFFLTDEGLDDVGEGNMEVRPYSYYPNPAKDQLHLNYSPDVQPTKIELYDLQGRLVRTQSNGLENVNMQNFAAGRYLMKVTLEDGKVYTNKVVKE